ncbi:MAG: tRNA pseudouridine(38-40) synthase TruA [Candidatus Brocadiae bacterium]|nr:tRNA pseudouridine(38-40) synthase TruA [Candidatus Brocadiia bacterium]
MRNIKLTIEYDGTNYHGWQEQDNLQTIQGCLKQAIYDLCKENVIIYGAGRTDAGVHAKAQIANFRTESKIPDYAFAKALNTLLPEDIAIKASVEVPDSFHSQFAAQKKAYSYNIINRKTRPTMDRKFMHWVWVLLDIDRMQEGANYLLGKHDFSAFEAANSPRQSSVRTIYEIRVEKKQDYVKIWVEADGFLYHMVRNIAGTLIAVGKKKYAPEHIKRVLESRNRTLAASTAPACGLCLEYIEY